MSTPDERSIDPGTRTNYAVSSAERTKTNESKNKCVPRKLSRPLTDLIQPQVPGPRILDTHAGKQQTNLFNAYLISTSLTIASCWRDIYRLTACRRPRPRLDSTYSKGVSTLSHLASDQEHGAYRSALLSPVSFPPRPCLFTHLPIRSFVVHRLFITIPPSSACTDICSAHVVASSTTLASPVALDDRVSAQIRRRPRADSPWFM